jgi:hypothetical protein
MKILSLIRLLLIGLWLGAACFFSFAVAQSAGFWTGARYFFRLSFRLAISANFIQSARH